MRPSLLAAFAAAVVLSSACSKTHESTGPAAPSSSAKPAASASTPLPPGSDEIATTEGPLRITPIHHATMLLEWSGLKVYVDPWSEGNHLAGLPKADLIFITDNHPDHLDTAAIELLRTKETTIVGPQVVADKVPGTTVLSNGDTRDFRKVVATAVPMYNLTRGPKPGALFHDKGRGNGYVLAFSGKRVYVSGDTECTPEMKALQNIDVAFVCMNLPYTMPPAEAAECVAAFRPKVVYPYHYRDSKLDEFTAPLAKTPGVEVRLRSWY